MFVLPLVLPLSLQDDAPGVLCCSALCAAALAGPALVPGSPGHPHLLPGQRRMEVPEDLCQNHRQRLTVRGFESGDTLQHFAPITKEYFTSTTVDFKF